MSIEMKNLTINNTTFEIVDDKARNDLAAEVKRATEAEDNRIKKFYTGNLGAVNIADSDDGAVRDLVIGGRSEQLRTNGYQLLDPNVFQDVSEYNGRKIINNKDGSFTAVVHSGATDVTNLTPLNSRLFDISPETTYITSGASNSFLLMLALWDSNKKRTRYIEPGTSFTTTANEVYVSYYIQCKNNVEGTYTTWPMFEKGATAHDWEPYTGGAPSPSPDYPQEIKSVENCAMNVSNADGMETQTALIPVTLRGIGDVRDELYVYADGSGKLVRRYPDTLAPTMTVVEQALETPIVTALTAEQVKALYDLRTYYGGTNISYQSDNGVEPVVNFDYACALENFVEYIKAAQGDDRKFIYDMDERMTDAEYVAALAYVNSEYAAALTELEV